ncbi:glycosyltransferase family 2 protein [Leptolyngbya sp. AN03gr2]|uniref:glycosyltransferase family 2 protein n=1 Tax=unclassified Leptolyngbya TaxID=2650499 RepID=UPI003D31EFE1
MKVSVLINNYNYQNYVVEAIESVLQQSVKVDEIIVVDDRSTDDSARILQDKFGQSEAVKLILKEQNEGQLAAFQAGFEASTGDLVCFLDADDLYKETYIETILKFYQAHPVCEFLFLSADFFGAEERISSCYPPQCFSKRNYRDLGYSKLTTLHRKTWIGHRTSTVSMRRSVLEKLFPLPFLEDWRIRADDCLVYGASIVGARKFYLEAPLVKYRVHGSNGHYGTLKTKPPDYFDRYNQSVDRLFDFLAQKFDIPGSVAHEFKSIAHPLPEEFETARSLLRGLKLSRPQKLLMLSSMSVHFLINGVTKPSIDSSSHRKL